MPALAPVLRLDTAGAVISVVAVGSAVDELDCGPLGTAENCSGGAAWNVSVVGVPVQALSPQQAQSCEV